MATRGYWEAFNAVEKSMTRILRGENAGIVANDEHGTWYRALFAPIVATGLSKPSDLAGYRNAQEYIGHALHVPLNKEIVLDALPFSLGY